MPDNIHIIRVHQLPMEAILNKILKTLRTVGPARWRKWLKVLALHARDPIWALLASDRHSISPLRSLGE